MRSLSHDGRADTQAERCIDDRATQDARLLATEVEAEIGDLARMDQPPPGSEASSACLCSDDSAFKVLAWNIGVSVAPGQTVKTSMPVHA